MIGELALLYSLNTTAPEDFAVTETDEQRIVREMFKESYKEKRSILKTRKVVVPIEDRTDFVLRFRRKEFFTVVYYFNL
jgi:hypothetical protein